MATFTSGHDVEEKSGDSSVVLDHDNGDMRIFYMGYFDAGSVGIVNNELRFTSVTIPKNATILSATLSLTKYMTGDATNVRIRGRLGADPALAPTWATRWSASGSNTTAYVDWSPANGGGGTVATSPSLVSVIQELVNQSVWASGQYLGLLILYNNDTSTNRLQFVRGSLSANPPYLDITYAVGGAKFSAVFFM